MGLGGKWTKPTERKLIEYTHTIIKCVKKRKMISKPKLKQEKKSNKRNL